MVQQIYTQNKNTRLFGLFSIKARNNKKNITISSNFFLQFAQIIIIDFSNNYLRLFLLFFLLYTLFYYDLPICD